MPAYARMSQDQLDTMLAGSLRATILAPRAHRADPPDAPEPVDLANLVIEPVPDIELAAPAHLADRDGWRLSGLPDARLAWWLATTMMRSFRGRGAPTFYSVTVSPGPVVTVQWAREVTG